MSNQKPRSKRRCPKSTPLGKEILAGLSEFTEALETGEVSAHLPRRDGKADAANHRPKSRPRPGKNGKKVDV